MIDDLEQYVASNYDPLDVQLVEGQGEWLCDAKGKTYVDLMSAYSAVSHGHCHPRIVEALYQQASTLAVCSRAYRSPVLEEFCAALCALTQLDVALPMTTGAEAVETAIKIARRWGYQRKGVHYAPLGGRWADIIVAFGNFHGRTTTIVGFSSEPNYQRGFGPFADGFWDFRFGDLDQARYAVEIDPEQTCAILIEPIQGEAGVIIPPDGFLKGLRNLCDEYNILLIFDEVQSGLGRTGKLFAHQHEPDVKPDMIILGKALGGGVLPVSAVVGRREVMDVMTPGSHGSTFGGTPLAAAVGLEALRVIEDEGLVEHSRVQGDILLQRLKLMAATIPAVREVRGRGLWAGMEFHPGFDARLICERLAEKRILTKDTRNRSVLRFAPPLMIHPATLTWALDQVQEVLQELPISIGDATGAPDEQCDQVSSAEVPQSSTPAS